MNNVRKIFSSCIVVAWCMLAPANHAAFAAEDPAATLVMQVIKSHCVKCHGPNKQEGDFRLDDLSTDENQDVARWNLVHEQIRGGLMPPEKEPRIAREKLAAVLEWLSQQASKQRLPLPNQGNLIAHELLFSQPAAAGDAPPGRVWRLNPEGYMGFAALFGRGRPPVGVIQPFTVIPERGIKDYADLYSVDEPSAEILLRNAEVIVNAQTGYSKIALKNVSNPDAIVKEFVALMKPDPAPTKKELEAAIQIQYRIAIGRTAEADEVQRLFGLYEKAAQGGDTAGAARTMLQAVLLRTDAIYRSEMGAGSGRRILTPLELSRAVSLTLGDRREPILHAAALKGELTTKEQVAAHVKRILDDPKIEKTRILKFFREYFEYAGATEVFKDQPKTFFHGPIQYVADTDRLVKAILAEDKDVFRELLTTDKAFVNYTTKENKQTKQQEPARSLILNPNNHRNNPDLLAVEYVVGIDKWVPEQPLTLPPETRIGILMQPSWLTAWSTNFDNDPVRRGRWIRERLLGGTVPDLPIGVAAQVPDEPHRTFRDRLTVTRADACWKCHKQMDELGLPFEQFDHYGRFRKTEEVLDVEATEKNVDKKGKSLGKVYKQAPLNTAGIIAESGDPKLDGPVQDPREMIRNIANSDRARQVFIRHVFRFYLGRNETLSDARTLQEADQAYLHSGGSFKALLTSLLTSDSFLYRTNKPSEASK